MLAAATRGVGGEVCWWRGALLPSRRTTCAAAWFGRVCLMRTPSRPWPLARTLHHRKPLLDQAGLQPALELCPWGRLRSHPAAARGEHLFATLKRVIGVAGSSSSRDRCTALQSGRHSPPLPVSTNWGWQAPSSLLEACEPTRWGRAPGSLPPEWSGLAGGNRSRRATAGQVGWGHCIYMPARQPFHLCYRPAPHTRADVRTQHDAWPCSGRHACARPRPRRRRSGGARAGARAWELEHRSVPQAALG